MLKIVPTSSPSDWLPGEGGCIARSRFGEIWLVDLTEGDRTHTRPLFIDRGGTVVLIVDRKGNVVLAKIGRPVCKNGARILLPISDPIGALGSLGSLEPETPRGYAEQLESVIESGMREAGEETGLLPNDVIAEINLGEAFPNGFNPQPIDFVVLVVNRQIVLETQALVKLREVIEDVQWVSEETVQHMIAEGLIRDQPTLVIWAKYQAKKKVSPELFENEGVVDDSKS